MKKTLFALATTVALISSTSAFAVVKRTVDAPAAGNWNTPAAVTADKEAAKPAAKHTAKKAKSAAKAKAKTDAKGAAKDKK